MQITKKSFIGQIIQEYPELSEFLLENGLSCIGCPLSRSETIEEGLIVHGKSEEEVEEILEKINEKIKDE